MPGAAQWKVITDRSRNHCWHCDLHAYGLVMWNEHVGAVDDTNYDAADVKHVVGKLQHVLSDDKLKAMDTGCPFVTGSFTNWVPKPMSEIVAHCTTVDVEKPTMLSLA